MARRVVVKVGSALLVECPQRPSQAAWLEALIEDCCRCAGAGSSWYVSSAAISLGSATRTAPQLRVTMRLVAEPGRPRPLGRWTLGHLTKSWSRTPT